MLTVPETELFHGLVCGIVVSGMGLRKTSHISFPSPCAVCTLATISLRSCWVSARGTSSGWECWMFCPPCESMARLRVCRLPGRTPVWWAVLWPQGMQQWSRVKFVISWLKGALHAMRCGLQKVMVRKMQRF